MSLPQCTHEAFTRRLVVDLARTASARCRA
ncbi:hypothetical protein SAMN06264364_10562 [Quadrisphaera granulorum]|uniref:Uncharacterized protein n=1 Tax=Quadrisphaera granulorum TaxID=317664 RepID=A0A316AAC3_9ACTN|nr:hypothetical protein BXY45_10562 [Quadrisphaera granulorum]SZE95802.1 hypothetical protein SAMN06264364_10562 [Quadrisphaera granulorum]